KPLLRPPGEAGEGRRGHRGCRQNEKMIVGPTGSHRCHYMFLDRHNEDAADRLHGQALNKRQANCSPAGWAAAGGTAGADAA
ncbi:hypothetical protein, partial [Mesorhizobium sp. M8A.F.Ca.ET.182.01.1.1]|uniref:hypothetical protein n=1 Tax=Mesorhizobium sp. M8A.F.Ca.ET.182.01.1.1 TaxID=2563964 RepID=UPI001AEEEF28